MIFSRIVIVSVVTAYSVGILLSMIMPAWFLITVQAILTLILIFVILKNKYVKF